MQNINIPASQSTPSVFTNVDKGLIVIKGDSYPENSYEFFSEIIDWIKKFLGSSQTPLKLELDIIYMNTSSVKAIMDILDILEEAHARSRAVSVDWFYDIENDRVKELAEEFFEDYTFPFEIKING